MPVSEAQKKATTKFEHSNYKKICLRLPATEGRSAVYDRIAIAADQAGKSLNGFILEAIEEKLYKLGIEKQISIEDPQIKEGNP